MTNTHLGLFSSFLSSLSWALSTWIYRDISIKYRATFLNLIKGLLALLLFSAVVLFEDHQVEWQSPSNLVLVGSGIIGILLGDTFFFAALPRIGATLTCAIQCLAPPLTAILTFVFFGETLNIQKIFGVLLTSFSVGGLLYVHEATDKSSLTLNQNFFWGCVYAILASVCQAGGAVMAKPYMAIGSTFYVSLVRMIVPVIVLILWELMRRKRFFNDCIVAIQMKHFGKFVLASFSGTFLGIFLMMFGMRNAPVSLALAVNSTYPIWIMIANSIAGIDEVSKIGVLFVIGSIAGIWFMV